MSNEEKRNENPERGEEEVEIEKVETEEPKNENVEGEEEIVDNEASGLMEETETEKEEKEREETEKETEETEKEESEEGEAVGDETAAPVAEPKVETDKNRLAQQKVIAARKRVLSAEEELDECMRNIEEDLHRFESYEKEELTPVLVQSRHILEEVGVEELPEQVELLPEIELQNPEEEKLRIEDLSSGKAAAFFLALLGGIVILLGWYVFAAGKAGMALVPQGIPDLPFFSRLAATIADTFGQGENASVGAAIVVVTVLLVMWLIYTVMVAVRASRNIQQAEEIEEAAGFYCRRKEECKEKMHEIREHLENLDRTVRKYEVVLAEINAGLNRALHIEGVHDFDELHEKTKASVRELQTLLQELESLLATPMARSGVLTQESVESLRRAKRVINDHILHIYS